MSVISRPQLHLAQGGTAAPTCNTHWICVQLGYAGGDRRKERYIKTLIEKRGFPQPLPHEKWGGGISDTVSATRSEWIRAGVEEWLGRYLPPAAGAALDADAKNAAAHEMDRAAGELRLVAGTEARL